MEVIEETDASDVQAISSYSRGRSIELNAILRNLEEHCALCIESRIGTTRNVLVQLLCFR